MEAPPVNTVLVAVDGTDEAYAAAEYAVHIAARYGASLFVLHVIDRADHRAMRAGERDPATVSADGRAIVESVQEMGRDHEVTIRGATAFGFDPERKLVHPGSVVLDAAEEATVDFIVLPRESVETAAGPDGTLGKAAEYVLLYASQPVIAV